MSANTALRILLIEDNELDKRMLLRHLSADLLTDFVVHCAADLRGGLAAMNEGGFDCVLLDLSLPDSEGLASVDALLERCAKAPVVVLTGLDDPSVAVQAVRGGAQDYVTKQGTEFQLLGRAIRYAVARHSSETQLRTAQELVYLMQERERIARELHDTVIQQLFATGMTLQALSLKVPEELKGPLETSIEAIDSGMEQLRDAIFGLQDPALRRSVSEELIHVAESEEAALGFVPTVRLATDLDQISSAVSHDLIATVREALTNVAKHANASAVQIMVELQDGQVVLHVTDNGVGLPADLSNPGSRQLSGHGLMNMARRAEGLSGRFEVGPGPGGGTALTWRATV